MHKSFLTLVVLVMFGSTLSQVRAQSTGVQNQPRPSITNPKSSAPWTVTPVHDSTFAKKLCEEGEKLFEAEQFSQAIQKFQQALRIDDEYADAYAGLGHTYFEMKQWQKAVDNLSRAAELRTKQAKAQDDQFSSSPTDSEVASLREKPLLNSPANKLSKENSSSAATRRQTNQLATGGATNANAKMTPKTGANTADVKTLYPESRTKQPEETRQAANNTAASANKLSPIPNTDPVKTPAKESETKRPSTQGRPLFSAPADSQLKLPQAANSTSTMGKAAALATDVMRQPSPGTSVDGKTSTPNNESRETNSGSGTVVPAPGKNTSEQQRSGANNSPDNSLVKLPLTTGASTGAPARSETKQPANQNPAPANSTANAPVKQTSPANTNAELKTVSPATGLQRVTGAETRTAEQNVDLNSPSKSSSSTKANADLKTKSPASLPPPTVRKESLTAEKNVGPNSPSKSSATVNTHAALQTINLTIGPPPAPPEETRTAEKKVDPKSPSSESSSTTNADAASKTTSQAIGLPPTPREETRAQKNVDPNPPPSRSSATTNANADLKTSPAIGPPPVPTEQTRTAEKNVDPKSPSNATSAPNSSSVAANTVRPDSAIKPETKRTLQAKSDGPNVGEQKAEGAQVSLNVAPAPKSEGTGGVSPTPATTYGGDASLTRIYRVGPNDVLDVQLNESQSPDSTLFTVTPSGLLELPLLNEPLPVTGLTVEEIGRKLEAEFTKRALIDNPRVIVGVRDYASHTVLVSGLVKDSGTKFLRREAIPLYVVVADAQPLPEAARVTVVRSEQNQIYEIELTQAADMNLLIRSGDVITVLPNVTQFIYIGGEVKSAGEKTFRRGLTLTQLILAAGGVTPKAKVAQIVRDAGGGFLVPIRFDLQAIGSGKAADPVLKPGDRIVILR